jgi:hypothetical protein
MTVVSGQWSGKAARVGKHDANPWPDRYRNFPIGIEEATNTKCLFPQEKGTFDVAEYST